MGFLNAIFLGTGFVTAALFLFATIEEWSYSSSQKRSLMLIVILGAALLIVAGAIGFLPHTP